jgi:hypothetical protein
MTLSGSLATPLSGMKLPCILQRRCTGASQRSQSSTDSHQVIGALCRRRRSRTGHTGRGGARRRSPCREGADSRTRGGARSRSRGGRAGTRRSRSAQPEHRPETGSARAPTKQETAAHRGTRPAPRRRAAQGHAGAASVLSRSPPRAASLGRPGASTAVVPPGDSRRVESEPSLALPAVLRAGTAVLRRLAARVAATVAAVLRAGVTVLRRLALCVTAGIALERLQAVGVDPARARAYI